MYLSKSCIYTVNVFCDLFMQDTAKSSWTVWGQSVHFFLTSRWMCKSVGLKFFLLFATHLFIVNIYFFKTFPNRIILNSAFFTVRHWHELQYKRHGQYIWEINKWINMILGFIKSVSCKYIYLPLKLLLMAVEKKNLSSHYKFS